jgi:hypothetical protein
MYSAIMTWLALHATAVLIGVDVGFFLGALFMRWFCRPLFCARCHVEVYGIERIRRELRQDRDGPGEFRRWWKWWRNR